MRTASGSNQLATVLEQWFVRHSGEREAEARILGWCARKIVEARAEGHSCLKPDQLDGDSGEGSGRDAASVRAILTASRWCSDGSRETPLVLDRAGRLYFRRTWLAEDRLSQALARRIAAPIESDPVRAGELIREQFQEAAAKVDWQALAVAAAVRNRFTVITGGPGTGKTYTIARLIHVLRGMQQSLSFALAAPTGKAARRMKESLAAAKVTDLPESQTLHALLGFQGGKGTFARGERDPLPHDLVIVDEASMADVELVHALVAAMRPEARLVLVGDRDQLPSVDLGQILADLCGMAQPELGVGKALATWSRHAGLQVDERADDSASDPMASAVVALRVTHRFKPDSGLGRAAVAIARRKAEAVMEVVDGKPADLLRVEPGALRLELQRLQDHFVACRQGVDPKQALAAHNKLRVLCVQNEGPHSVADLNRRIEQQLNAFGTWYHGRPVLVTRNDADLGLNNGDLGVCLHVDGTPKVFFASDTAEPRSFLPEQLPEHRTAWAMTVHKAQGSEADEVLLVLPPKAEGQVEKLLQAPLVYTGLTRAKVRATIVADRAVLQKALGTWPTRASGLADALRAALGS